VAKARLQIWPFFGIFSLSFCGAVPLIFLNNLQHHLFQPPKTPPNTSGNLLNDHDLNVAYVECERGMPDLETGMLTNLRVPRSKLLILWMVIPPLIGNPYNGYVNTLLLG